MNTLIENIAGQNITLIGFIVSTLLSMLFGFIIAFTYQRNNTCSKSFALTIGLLPAIIQLVIMMVNGNIGTGVAVMGAFSLVRFRSMPGSASEITFVFLSMAVGLATGMGYIIYALLFIIIFIVCYLLFNKTTIFNEDNKVKELQITIPENLYRTTLFDEIFTDGVSADLVRLKTTNMGSLYKLIYHIMLNGNVSEKELIDKIRCRNGNLEVSIGVVSNKTEL